MFTDIVAAIFILLSMVMAYGWWTSSREAARAIGAWKQAAADWRRAAEESSALLQEMINEDHAPLQTL
jgi:hypothetical protein